MNNFFTILPVFADFLYASWISCFKELTASFEVYSFFVQQTFCTFPGGPIKKISFLNDDWPFLVSLLSITWILSCAAFFRRHLNLFAATSDFFPGYLPIVGFLITLSFLALDISTRFSDVFYSKLPIAPQYLLSFVPPPSSICRYRILSDRRSSLFLFFLTVSRFRLSVAGITFRFHRSTRVSAYGPSSLYREAIADISICPT